MKTDNKPGEPIVTRERGAYFYCLNCLKEYRKCQCKVYLSADTLKHGKTSGFWSRNGQSGEKD